MLVHKLKRVELSDEEKKKFRELLDCSDMVDWDWSWGYLCCLLDLERFFRGQDTFDNLCREYRIIKKDKPFLSIVKFFIKYRDYLRGLKGDLTKVFIGYDKNKKEFYIVDKKSVLIRVD